MMIRMVAISSLTSGRSTQSFLLAQSFLLERPFRNNCCLSSWAFSEFPKQWSSQSQQLVTMQQSITKKRSIILRPSIKQQCRLSLKVDDDNIIFSSSTLSQDDLKFLSEALDYARLGKGHTFPNPAVGCVLVDQESQRVLGAGFHPRAGYPHAEIFALLQATGHVKSGVDAARAVVMVTDTTTASSCSRDVSSFQALMQRYLQEDGPRALFGDVFAHQTVTAYVTLEPCCHYGKTPPCASSLALAKVDRVVVGFRDPNPRVDGGGVQVLRDAGIQVDMVNDTESIREECAQLVKEFVKRIIPKDYDSNNYCHITGAMRRILRSIAAKKKNDETLVQVNWTGKVEALDENSVEDLDLPTEWMERLDGLLWEEELVNVRLNRAVGKKKLSRQLGERIAKALGAHVAQSVGHTVLLYRPGIPPILDLEQFLVAADESKEYNDQQE